MVSANTTQKFEDPSKAVELLAAYKERDGLDVDTLMNSKLNGGLTYNDFLLLPGKIGVFDSLFYMFCVKIRRANLVDLKTSQLLRLHLTPRSPSASLSRLLLCLLPWTPLPRARWLFTWP